jgi:hypothetical protein
MIIISFFFEECVVVFPPLWSSSTPNSNLLSFVYHDCNPLDLCVDFWHFFFFSKFWFLFLSSCHYKEFIHILAFQNDFMMWIFMVRELNPHVQNLLLVSCLLSIFTYLEAMGSIQILKPHHAIIQVHRLFNNDVLVPVQEQVLTI